MPQIFMPENAKQFECKICDFICSKNSNFQSHLSTAKHINATLCYTNANQNVIPKLYICSCSKEYKHHSSFHRHKKTCIEEAAIKELKEKEKEGVTLKMTDIQGAIPNMDMSLIFAFMKDTQEFKQIMVEQSNTMMEYNKQMISD